jgi:hypothetical protein
LDEDLLRSAGQTDFTKYATHANVEPQADIYIG